MQSTDTLKIITDSLLNEGHLRKIQEFTQETASNTAFSFWREADFWEYIAIGLSVHSNFICCRYCYCTVEN